MSSATAGEQFSGQQAEQILSERDDCHSTTGVLGVWRGRWPIGARLSHKCFASFEGLIEKK